MPDDLADSLKADEKERKTDHAPLFEATENEEADGDDRDEPPAGLL